MTPNTPLDVVAVPKHVAIVMDGNGRWAKERGLPRLAGHKAGAEAVRRTIKAAQAAGVANVTLFGFSTENWARPKDEVNGLMLLLRQYLLGEGAELHKNNIRLRVIGFRERMPVDVVKSIQQIEALTHKNTSGTLTLALDYGGQQDVVQAVQRIVEAGIPAEAVNASVLESFLLTAGLPPVDLFIRSSGEQRLSNFMLWNLAYAELYFTPTLWPDFNEDTFNQALNAFQNRDRRFGALAPQRGEQ